MSSFTCGMALASRRLMTPQVAVPWLAAIASVAAIAFAERYRDAATAATNSLAGVALGLCVPLMCYWLTRAAMAGTHPTEAVAAMARVGMHRRGLVSGVLLMTTVAGMVTSAVLAVTAVLSAGGTPGISLFKELGIVIGMAGLVGWSYACVFAAASTVGKNGGGRRWVLLLDWLLGTGATAIALPWPRAHARNLLGLDAVVGMPQWAAGVALAMLAAVATAWVTFRTPA